ncbi:uncharacterized protein C8orf58 homolog [Bubalus kerabau]|uniref:uncharacterized protein C8orf58 homolog n=1 Tax=Bubalus carabanensis TaxID=3119969 RepID=UPI00244EE003|nr:uncharacterized protein C8orf58 homolog [Bubalus carabanensis]
MLGRRRVFALEPLGGQGESPTQGRARTFGLEPTLVPWPLFALPAPPAEPAPPARRSPPDLGPPSSPPPLGRARDRVLTILVSLALAPAGGREKPSSLRRRTSFQRSRAGVDFLVDFLAQRGLVWHPDGAGEDLAHGCVVPGVISTYRQIPDVAPVCSSDSWKRQDQLRGPQGQVPLLKLGSQDSGVEMAVGDSSPATSPSFSQDSLNFEPLESAESLALGALEPPAHLSRLLASRKLEQVLERSHQLSVPPTSLSQHCHSPKLLPKCEMPHSEARGPEATEAESDLEDGLEQAEVEDLGPEACSGLLGQGLRYLEHLCAVLEQVANLQQLCLQLQTQRGPADPEEEEETTLAPSPLPSYAPGNEVRGPWEWLSQTEETGAKTASPPKVGAPSASPPRLSEALTEPAHTSSSQEHKGDRSHWNKVKVLLNRIRWGSPRPAELATSADGPVPRIASRNLPEKPLGHPLQKTFMPSLVVKKKQDKNLSVH